MISLCHFANISIEYPLQLWYDDTTDGPNIIRRQYEVYRGEYSEACGRKVSASDLDLLTYSTGNSFPITADGTFYGLMAFRPIFDEG